MRGSHPVPSPMDSITVNFYDTKPYDQKAFLDASKQAEGIVWRFHEFRLNADTAASAAGAQAVCVFVNDQVDATCIAMLAQHGVRLVALRCAGFNNVDLAAAKNHGIAVVRVPAYWPRAVAEHAVSHGTVDEFFAQRGLHGAQDSNRVSIRPACLEKSSC